ncbi:MAG: DUF559 domain-containing protein [Phycisphaeraceae bacterium]|nr:DUF559 domain-containing protein [Phycisphaeraceae bacterium]
MPVPRATDEKIERAKMLRAQASVPERVLWSKVRDRKLGDLKFRRQQAIGHLVVDFYCADARLVVELDGDHHGKTRVADAARDAFLHAQGLEVVRLSVRDFMKHQHASLEYILRVARSRLPSGPLSPEGRGLG